MGRYSLGVSLSLSLLCLCVLSPSAALADGEDDTVGNITGEWTALLEQQWAVDTHGHRQKLETRIQPKWVGSVSDSMELTAIGRLRLDAYDRISPSAHTPENYSEISMPWYNSAHAEFQLREFFIDAEFLNGFWRVGKQQIVWGQADGIKLLDVVNPQSYREFILEEYEDSRIPLWSVNYEVDISDDASLQLLWIPDLTFNELAEPDKTFAFTAPEIIPRASTDLGVRVLSTDKPDNGLSDGEWGVKYSLFAGGWDLTLNYLYHYQDNPVLYQTLVGATPADLSVEVTPTYERNHLVGGTASNAIGDFTVRSEIGYNSDTYHVASDLNTHGIQQSDELAFVFGLDYQGLSDVMLSAQWFQSHLLDYDRSMERRQTKNSVTFLYRHNFLNETWELEVLNIHAIESDDGVVQAKLSHMLESNLELWLGSDVFYGNNEGVFGQFDHNDRWVFGVEWGI